MASHRLREVDTRAIDAGLHVRAGVANDITSKHAVVGLTRAAAIELGLRGIRVIGIAPSMT